MTRSITLFVTVAGLALALAVPAAFGQNQPAHDDFWNYDSSGRKIADTSPGVTPQDLARLHGPSVAAQGPSVTPYGFDWSTGSQYARRQGVPTAPDVVDRAVAAREESAGRTLNFDNYKIDEPTTVIVARPTSSGEELEWPQLGIGFGIGLLLALGLGLALRMMHIRPLAH